MKKNSTYWPIAVSAISLPLTLLVLSKITGDSFSVKSMFMVCLLMVIFGFAMRGMSEEFREQPVAERSFATLAKQSVLSGILFSTFMTLMFELALFVPTKSDFKILTTFFIMAISFGSWTFLVSWLQRRKTTKTN